MDIRIDKSKLLKGLYLAHGIADRKSTMPILANVLVRTEGTDRISCAATDLKVAIVVTLPAKVEQRGRYGRCEAGLRNSEGPVRGRSSPSQDREQLAGNSKREAEFKVVG